MLGIVGICGTVDVAFRLPEQSEQREQREQHEQREQREQSEQFEQYEQLVQLSQFFRLSRARCANSLPPKYSTEHLFPRSSVSHSVFVISRSIL